MIKPYFKTKLGKLYHGACEDVMATLDSNSIDTIITDPPYGLNFMGKKWDYDVPSTEIWQECLRVLKPGGTALIFAGSRTQHRMACNVEDAGFILKDCIMWVYGSGFPKATDISKQIDKIAENNDKIIQEKQNLGNWLKEKRGDRPQKEIAKYFPSKTGKLTGCVANWELGFNLPSWETWTILKDILCLDDRYDYLIKERPLNYIEAERKIIGKNNRGYKAHYGNNKAKNREINITESATQNAQLWDGWKSHGLKPAYEPILVCMKPNEGSYADNALKWGVAGLNIDGGRIDAKERPKRIVHGLRNDVDYSSNSFSGRVDGSLKSSKAVGTTNQGRYPANIILDEEAGRLLDEQSGILQSGVLLKHHKQNESENACMSGKNYKRNPTKDFTASQSGASRFFYCAKASKSERNTGLCGSGKKETSQDPTDKQAQITLITVGHKK